MQSHMAGLRLRSNLAKLLGIKVVSLSYFKKYKKAMQEHLKRKDKRIKQLEREKEAWRKTAVKQTQKNYDLEKRLKGE